MGQKTIDYNEIIYQIDKELKRIGWTKEKAVNHIQFFYGVKSRMHLKDGDRLIAKVPVFRPNPHKSSHTGKEEFQIIINSSEEVEVIGQAVQGRDKNQGWDYW